MPFSDMHNHRPGKPPAQKAVQPRSQVNRSQHRAKMFRAIAKHPPAKLMALKLKHTGHSVLDTESSALFENWIPVLRFA